MKTKKYSNWLIALLLTGWVFSSCVKENSAYISKPKKDENVTISFMHFVNGVPVNFDTLLYTTSIGNQYMVNDLQYFVSGIRLHQKKGKWLDIGADQESHYIDVRIPGTDQWKLFVSLPDEEIDSLSFVFGLDMEDNISYRFPDPPERDMFWPEVLGGGYHYMKMNMKWKKPGMVEQKPFMFHLGIGQMYAGNTIDPDSIIGYIPNYFTVRLPFNNRVQPEVSKPFCTIIMNVEKWFDGPYTFDFDDYPKGIMQNQEGMFKAAKNGMKAFDIADKNY